MPENKKDVIAADIKLGTGSILPAFKKIDEGVKSNADSFKALNSEIQTAEKTYASLSKAMDKTVLSSDERRKKIMEESNALVAQRRAQAELLKAKAQKVDVSNNISDSKLAAQQAIQKKRQDAIEQQEKEHQQRMATLQRKAATAGSQENIMQAKLDRQYQQMKSSDARLEMEAERHAARMKKLSDATLHSMHDDASGGGMRHGGLVEGIKQAALHATVFHGVYTAINAAQEMMRVGFVDIEANMAGYVQTNEKYFVSFNEGTHEMVMNTQRLHEETTKFIHTAHDLGAEINDVTESARLWGRMYKDAAVVQEMVRQSTKLSTVDLVALEDATKMMEATLAQYSVQIKNVTDAQVQGNRILDSWSKVAHDTMAPARDLGAAFERTGKIAAETGVGFDMMNGLISSGIRNTALSGENLGNMWKTVLGTIRTDKAVNELESLGVATKEVVNGTEQWRRAEDILLDLSVKVLDKNYDLTKSYQDISRGVFQFAKLAASLNVGDILLGTSASINSTGSTAEYLKVQMDTIQRKAAQTRASLLEIFNSAGDDGLRQTIKDALDAIDQLLIGLTKVPKEVYTGMASIGALVVAYKSIYAPVMAWVSAERALSAAKAITTIAINAETTAVYAQTAAMAQSARMTALATGGITLLAGAIAVYLFKLGAAEKAERNAREEQEQRLAVQEQLISQADRQSEFFGKAINTHNQLTEALKNENLTSEQKANITAQLDKVEQALKETIGEQGLQRLKTAGFTKEAIKIEMDALEEKREKAIKQALQMIEIDKQETQAKINGAKDRIKAIKAEMQAEEAKLQKNKKGVGIQAYGGAKASEYKIDNLTESIGEQEKIVNEAEKTLSELSEKAASILTAGVDVLSGRNGAAEYEGSGSRKDLFASKMSAFKHMVNIEAEGYRTAAEQLEKLKQIRNEFSDLNTEDLYSIDEDIYRTSQGKAMEAKGMGSDDKNFVFPLNDIDNEKIQAEQMLQEINRLIEEYNAQEFTMSDMDKYSKKSDLYAEHQIKLHKSNELLRSSIEKLSNRQEYLNDLYESGQITADEYNKSTEDVQSRIKTITDEVNKNSIAWWNDAKAIKEAKEQQLQASYDSSMEWLTHQKAIREMSVREELAALIDVQSRYEEGTEIRMRLDEQVYVAKKALLQEEKNALDELVTKEKQKLSEAKEQELEDIQKRRDEYVEAQDEKIRALDRLMAAEEDRYEDEDYEETLKEKKARLEALQSAVGPEAIKERRELEKEIEKLEEEHERVLTRRANEAEKQRLEDEKREKEKAFDEEKQAVEDHYDELIKALDQYKDDVESRAETIKQIQILKEQEKNEQVLASLDKFIAEYKKKMESIASMETTQKDIDLAEYNSNKDRYEDAKARGDTAEMERLQRRNDEIRSKYGIPEDTGKLQQFANGGLVRGMRGEAVPVVAHAGEMYLNERQQSNLFKVIDYAIPKISWPSMAISGPQNVVNNYYSFDNSINGGVSLEGANGVSGLYDQRTGLIERQRALGGKVR